MGKYVIISTRAGEPANFLASPAPHFFSQAAPASAPGIFVQAAPAPRSQKHPAPTGSKILFLTIKGNILPKEE